MRCEETTICYPYLDQELDVVRHTDMAQHLDSLSAVRNTRTPHSSGAVGAPDGLALYNGSGAPGEAGAVGGAPGPLSRHPRRGVVVAVAQRVVVVAVVASVLDWRCRAPCLAAPAGLDRARCEETFLQEVSLATCAPSWPTI